MYAGMWLAELEGMAILSFLKPAPLCSALADSTAKKRPALKQTKK
jgi:hypothetical protein